MRKPLFSIIIAGLALALPALTVRAASGKGQLDDRIKHINNLGEKNAVRDVALQRVSVETGVPLDRVQAMHQRNRDVGVGGLLVANVLADETKKDPESFMKEHSKGKSWTAIAKENNVAYQGLSDRLDRLERAISMPDKPEKNNKSNKRKG